MIESDSEVQERIDLDDDRDRRALEEYLSVVSLEGTPVDDDDTVVQVVSQSGEAYHVDADVGVCECSDYKYRDPAGGCKHVRRARIELSLISLDAATLAAADVDPQLGTNAPGPRVVTSDGGVVTGEGDDEPTVREATTDAEILENDDVDPFKGPFTEYDKYGEPTGHSYVRCRDCGREALVDRKEHVTHRDGCRFADQ